MKEDALGAGALEERRVGRGKGSTGKKNTKPDSGVNLSTGSSGNPQMQMAKDQR